MTAENGQTDPTAAAQPERLRVLLVDDNASVLRFLASAFSSNHCQVTTAATAEQALEQLGDDPFDLVVSDIKMPGLSGLDLLRAVKVRQPATPVVLMTGVPSINSAVFGLRHGAYDYLPKPFSVKEVQQLVQRLRARPAVGQCRNGTARGADGGASPATGRDGGDVPDRRGGAAGVGAGIFVRRCSSTRSRACGATARSCCCGTRRVNSTPSRKGDPALVGQILSLLHSVVQRRGPDGWPRHADAHDRRTIRTPGLAALVPGVGRSMGILCLARDPRNGSFLPDEKEFLLGYAQTTALALQQILLRENLETNLIDTIASFVSRAGVQGPVPEGPLRARVALRERDRATWASRRRRRPDPSRVGMLHDIGKLVIIDYDLPQAGAADRGGVRAHHAAIPWSATRSCAPLRFLASARRRRSSSTTSGSTARAIRTG